MNFEEWTPVLFALASVEIESLRATEICLLDPGSDKAENQTGTLAVESITRFSVIHHEPAKILFVKKKKAKNIKKAYRSTILKL